MAPGIRTLTLHNSPAKGSSETDQILSETPVISSHGILFHRNSLPIIKIQ